jgi:predicted DNA-binding transcriptional regulator AlpA
VTRNDTKNPLRALNGVIPSRSVRSCHERARQTTGSIVHLSGMDLTLQTSPQFLTQHEVAEMLRLPERTLEDWRLTHSGPPYLKLGRHVRYDVQDVLTWVQEHRHG